MADARRLDEIRAFISGARWTFARTMPQHPHWYTVRNEDARAGFEAFVTHIRAYGYPETFGGRSYVYLDLDGYTYWTMGAPLAQTVIINRKPIDRRRGQGQG